MFPTGSPSIDAVGMLAQIFQYSRISTAYNSNQPTFAARIQRNDGSGFVYLSSTLTTQFNYWANAAADGQEMATTYSTTGPTIIKSGLNIEGELEIWPARAGTKLTAPLP